MRLLTDQEAEAVFFKLAKYIGKSMVHLVDRANNPHGFYLHRDRVYYVSEAVARMAQNIPRDSLLGLGTCFGKFTKSGKFRLHITALDHIAPYARYKLWLKSTGEMTYLYGNNVLKTHVAKMTEDIPEYQGIVVYSHKDLPLGFSVTAKSSVQCQGLDPTGTVGLHQADIGEYLRDEDILV